MKFRQQHLAELSEVAVERVQGVELDRAGASKSVKAACNYMYVVYSIDYEINNVCAIYIVYCILYETQNK